MKAKRLAARLHYQQGQTNADHVIAFALYKRGLYAESLELFSNVLSGYQQLADTANISRVYMDMAAVLHKDLSDQTKVIAFMQKAIQTGKKLKNDSVLSLVYFNYCNFNANLSADSVNYYLGKSREIASQYNDEYMLALNHSKQVYLLNRKGQKPEVLPIAKQLLASAQRMGNVNLEVYALLILANYYHENDLQKALGYYNQICDVAQESGDNELQIYYLTAALGRATKSGNKNEIIKAYATLEKAMIADRENMKRFIGDYVRYNAIADDNKLLSAENARRALWLLGISFSAAIIVLAIYLTMLRRSRKAKEQIDALNNVANMQIIAMEEVKHEAIREEQQRLGQDLHDGLSSSIASIKHQLETLSMDTDDPLQKKKLVAIQLEIANAYDVARNKSHEWFNTADGEQEHTFEQRIKLLTDTALPDTCYKKNIHIDDDALQHASMDVRIALLRIVQEAITNIIKHAKAKKVGILIYAEIDKLIMVIQDDGTGWVHKTSTNVKSGMGLQSIRRRVQYLNGKTAIRSDTKGTEIAVSIPLALS
ncbi:sensor histidine kinase [Sphingobacterium pedocola]|uniref:histidine kinase n=1 Tax=Sphingobacterium pedocola TaxID=2082722 RepID=A0ABR9T298_9SPHI|nr:ATP-binding protein [Sphingobacterium pedocola]MBE8719463.1 hypothetical protein [Sphingobacterium pedocola]